MVLSRFWLVIFISSIAFVLISLFSGNSYTLDFMINGKKDDPIIISEKYLNQVPVFIKDSIEKAPDQKTGRLEHYLKKNEKQNKSYAHNSEIAGSKKAVLSYTLMKSSDKYHLLEVELETGRHHQIRCQLATIGCIIKGDLKYGSKRSNKDGGIYLHSREINFIVPL